VQISAVRQALADAASAVVLPAGTAALTCTGYAPDAVTVPAFYVGDYSITFDRAMRRVLTRWSSPAE
jgi:hypothetical protein